MSSRVRARGFSLIELMVVMAIGGVILAFSMPSINRYLNRARLRDNTNRMMNEMRLARQKFVGLDNYIAVFNDAAFWDAMARTFTLLAISLPVQIALGLGIALLLHKPGLGFLKTLTRLSLVIPMSSSPLLGICSVCRGQKQIYWRSKPTVAMCGWYIHP